MEVLKETSVLKFRPNTLLEVRKLYDLDKPGRMENAIKILEEWIQKQEHFVVKEFDRDYLERVIINSKGLLERAKIKLDRLCTFKTLWPEYFEQCDLQEIVRVPKYHDVKCDGLMPTLTPDNFRVHLVKWSNIKELNLDITLAHIKSLFLSFEYIFKNDYSAGIISIIDAREINSIEAISRINFNEEKKLFTVLQEGYGLRVKAIHYLSNSKALETLIHMMKPVVSKKIFERFHYHTTLESLHNEIPKEVLCADYGGYEMPLSELKKVCLDAMGSQEHKDYLEKSKQCRTDESKRLGDNVSEQYLHGTFRNLVVD